MRHLIILSLLVACTKTPAPPSDEAEPERAPVEVRIDGTLHGIHAMGMTQATVQLADVAGANVYGLGALEGLAGEVTVVGGEFVLARPNGGIAMVSRTRAPTGGAALLVSASVPEWTTHRIERELGMEELAERIEAIAGRPGPFPFLVRGRLGPIEWHVVDPTKLPNADGPTTCQAHAAAGIQGVYAGDAVVVGFFSKEHGGVFTKPDSHLHLHFVSTSESGHVDALTVPAGATLLLP